jgi:eukaryotic-like serine/threonine-protein kinase
MAIPHELPPRLAFGPFELNHMTGELLRGGIRVRLSAQPFQILVTLLKAPGELVTREQLREQTWDDDTFVDFEHGLNAAINKLRRTLGDTADHPRYIETVPGRGYRFIGVLETRDTAAGPAIQKTKIVEAAPRMQGSGLSWGWAAAAACALIFFAALLWLQYRPQRSPDWKLTRITADTVLSRTPAISNDGKLVAYSSELNMDGAQDLYLRQTAGGSPVRLTFDGEGNTTPDFSPDGSNIVFRSRRNGGGIYEIPTFGGEVRLLVEGGLNPKFSPDGSRVAYWVGTESVAAAVPGNGALWVTAGSGGQSRRVAPNFSTARYPIWSPDGKRLLFVGYDSATAFDDRGIDWWLVSVEGGQAIRTGAHDALLRHGLLSRDPGAAAARAVSPTPVASMPAPGCWSANRTVIFSIRNGDAQNLWEMPLSPNGQVKGSPQRLTTGSGNEVEPSCGANGVIAFSSLELKTGLWSLPVPRDQNIRRNENGNGNLQPLVQGPGNREHPSFSGEARYLTFSSDQADVWNIWIRDLQTGKESIAAASKLVQRYPLSSPSGARVVFSVFEKEQRALYQAAPGGKVTKLCDGCLRATAWSRNEKTLLVFGGSPYRIDMLDVDSHKHSPFLAHLKYSLLYARFSPDERWVSFTARVEPGRAHIMIAPVDGPKPIPEQAWTKIADVDADDYADWSPEGKVLYFTSRQDGHTCLWARRFDPISGHPIGDAFAVQHLHGHLHFRHDGWSIGGDRIGLALFEARGNVWVMSRSH